MYGFQINVSHKKIKYVSGAVYNIENNEIVVIVDTVFYNMRAVARTENGFIKFRYASFHTVGTFGKRYWV